MAFKCKDCPDRHPGCWSECKSYQAEKQAREQAREQRKQISAWYDYKAQRKNYKKPF